MLGLAMLVLCNVDTSRPKQERRSNDAKPAWNEVPQVCENCGREWLVTSLDGSPVPPTIEWCFHCGFYCEEGIGLAVRSTDAATHAELVNHCRTCVDCRRAAFTPEQWKAEESKCQR
jgi:hypothetical protein